MELISFEMLWKVWLFVSVFTLLLIMGHDWWLIKIGKYSFSDWKWMIGGTIAGPVFWISLLVACVLNGDVKCWIKKGLATLKLMVKSYSKKK